MVPQNSCCGLNFEAENPKVLNRFLKPNLKRWTTGRALLYGHPPWGP